MNRLTGRKLYLFNSPAYLASVLLLFLNDFSFKQAWPCWFTGKLSDFAGLFAFSVFTLVIWPARANAIGVALAFAFWKSPLAQPLNDTWNALVPYLISRVVDYTDL